MKTPDPILVALVGGFAALIIPGVIYAAVVSPPGTPFADLVVLGILTSAIAAGVLATVIVAVWWIIKFLGG